MGIRAIYLVMVAACAAKAPAQVGGDDAATIDAAITDAAPGDAGRDYSTDRTKFFGASRCAEANVLLCEDFEDGIGSAWTITGTTPVVDGGQYARGAKALHIMQTSNGASYIKEKVTFPVATNSYYGRAFFYFVRLPTTADMPYAHWTIVASTGTTPANTQAETRLSAQLQSGQNLFGVGTDDSSTGGTGDWTNKDADDGPMAVPLGSWVCLEWWHSGATNETKFWWDATEHPSMATTETVHGGNQVNWILPQYASVWLGWQEYQVPTAMPPPTFDLWVDEIAIDSERIGCVL
jgi:hypothetical protein